MAGIEPVPPGIVTYKAKTLPLYYYYHTLRISIIKCFSALHSSYSKFTIFIILWLYSNVMETDISEKSCSLLNPAPLPIILNEVVIHSGVKFFKMLYLSLFLYYLRPNIQPIIILMTQFPNGL